MVAVHNPPRFKKVTIRDILAIKMAPSPSQNMVIIIFLAEMELFTFFGAGDPGCVHSMDWRLVSGW